MVKKVLVINETQAASVIPELLANAGYEITETFDAETGSDQLHAHGYDLAVMLEDPVAESWLPCGRIRNATDAPIIIISSGASTETCVMAINAGADFFIRKPFGPMELMARINALWQRVPSRQPAPLVS